jgi:tetratricopeptide (TPR) repeat protein
MNADETYKEAQALEADGKHGKAAAVYEKLIKLAEDPRYYIAYGVCLQRLGHWEESVKQLQRGVDLKPHYCEGDARLFLAESLLQSGQKKRAIEQWKLVAVMEPEYPSYKAVPNEAKQKLREHNA